jgi:cytochrome c-type biogenesis protein CcmH
MTVFWSLAAIMVIFALLFMLPWLLRGARLADTDLDGLNAEVIRNQLAELEADLNTGRLDRSRYEAARHDLERELLYDLKRERQESKPVRSGQWLALVLLVAIPLAAVSLYNHLGTKQIIPLLARSGSTPAEPAPGAAEGAHSLDELVEKLATRLRARPDDLQGWRMLARSYEVLGRYPEAVTAYENVLRLGDSEPDTLADYADVLVMANGGRFDAQAGGLLQRALDQQPDNIKALWLMGHWKNQQADYTAAIDHWQRAAALLPPEGKDAEVIARQIAQARQRAGLPAEDTVTVAARPAAANAGAAPGAARTAAIQVSVSLDPQLAARADPDDTVFIFARAVSGPRMPLAITRRQVRDLPVSVTLDDSQAMSPAMTLSKFDQVSVGARVSSSGNAMPQSGDLQGSISPVQTSGGGNIELMISETVP